MMLHGICSAAVGGSIILKKTLLLFVKYFRMIGRITLMCKHILEKNNVTNGKKNEIISENFLFYLMFFFIQRKPY